MIGLDYADEKLGVAAEYLACLDKPLRHRLYKAFRSFHVLDPRMMPTDEMREDLESIRRRFYRIPPEEVVEGSNIIESLRLMDDAEAYKLAYHILRLHEDVHMARALEEEDF